MKRLGVALLLLMVSAPAWAQRQKLGSINTESPDGQLLQQIGMESDEARKIELLEQFLEKFQKHQATAWALAQLVPAYVKAGQFDKALEADEKLLGLDAEDVSMAHQGLKAAEGKKDPDLVIKWSNRTSEIARRVVAKPKPADEDDVEDWKRAVDYAQQVDLYTEYSLYAAALQTADPKKKVALGDALETRNPGSQYLVLFGAQRFLGYQQLGENDKAVAVAEKVLEKDQTNEDMLVVVANAYLERGQHPDKVLAYSAKLLELMNSKPKPDGASDADWNNKKTMTTGLAHWFAGITYSNQGRWEASEKSLSQTMPLIKSNDLLRAVALFHLGLSNYKLGKNAVARQYFEECSAVDGPMRQQALANLKAIPKKAAARK